MFCNINLCLSLHCPQNYFIFPPTPVIMRLNQLVSAGSAHGRTRSEAKVTKINKPSKIAVFCLSGDSHNKLLFVFQKFLQHRALFTTIFNCVFEVSKVWLIFFSSALLKINGCSRKNKNSVNFQIPVLLM